MRRPDNHPVEPMDPTVHWSDQIPDLLYKLYDTKSLDPLTKRSLRFTQPYEFNDPTDTKPRSVIMDNAIPAAVERMRKATGLPPLTDGERNDGLWNVYKARAQLECEMTMDGLRKRWAVCCMTESLSTPTMWSHYAESHKGYAVEYAVDDALRGLTRKVTYRTDRPALHMPMILGDLSDMFYIKGECWRYEREYRATLDAYVGQSPHWTPPLDDPARPLDVELSEGQITAVIAGERASSDLVRELRRISKEIGAEFRKARHHQSKYEMVGWAPRGGS